MADTTAKGGAAIVNGIHHFTIRCSGNDLESVRRFYCDVLGLSEGPRPDFGFPGHWLYVGEAALLHLAAILPDRPKCMADERAAGFDHVSLAGSRLDVTRQRLAELSVAFEELAVPGWPLWQIFLRDPVGSKIELTFELGAS